MEDEGEGRADGTHCHAWRYNSRMTIDNAGTEHVGF